MCKHAVCAHNTMQPLWCWGFQLVDIKKKNKKKRSVMEEGGMGEGQHSSKLV